MSWCGCWDLRRLIVPLSYFIEKPFQNWTREGSALIGSAMIYVDYRAPVGVIRDKLAEIVKNSEHWDQRVVKLQVTDVKEQAIELRCMMSAAHRRPRFRICAARCAKNSSISCKSTIRRRCRTRGRSVSVVVAIRNKQPNNGPLAGAEPSGGLTGRPIANQPRIAFSQNPRLSCLGIHQRRRESP